MSPCFLKDLLPDDGECDWSADELFGHNPRLLDGGPVGEAAASSYRQDLAKILHLPVHLHDLPVPAVCGHPSCSLPRPVQRNTYSLTRLGPFTNELLQNFIPYIYTF